MVQILPPKGGLSQELGQSIKQGFSKGFDQTLQTQYQRGLLQNALQKVRGLGQQEGTTPFDLAASLMEATAGIPGAEKYVGQLFPLLLSQINNTGTNQATPPPPGSMPSGPQGPANTQAGPNVQVRGQQPVNQGFSASSAINDIRQNFPDVPEPAGMPEVFGQDLNPVEIGMSGPIPKTYTPEQIDATTRDLRAKGLDPTAAIQQMERYNEGARAQIQDLIRGAVSQANVADLKTKRQNDFRQVLTNELQVTDPDDLAVAERMAYSDELKNISNDKLRANAVKKKFDAYQSTKNEFIKSSQRPNFDTKRYHNVKNNLQAKAKSLVQNGQFNLAKRILQENGWSMTETDEILNPLGKEVTAMFQNLPNITKVENKLSELPYLDFDNEVPNPKFQKQFEALSQQREKEIGIWRKSLDKVIKPGKQSVRNANLIDPGTSLLLLRNEAMKKGLDWQDFNSIASEYAKTHKLDPYQQEELQIIGKPPEESVGIGEFFNRVLPMYIERPL